ncbi:DUF6252 family protein [Rasiella sp. SM2506]|uniref:DUF6252 family protein n=1 Tax=Rasiella sp. SM2506 TaxID=3423914 RepID=UPI003D7A1738
MKILKNVLLVFLMSLAIMSCKKDDDGGDDPQGGEGTLTAKVNGSNFSSLEIATTANQSGGGTNVTVTIQGSDADGKGIFLIINAFDGVGTYEITDENVFITANYIEANVSNPANSQTWNAPYTDSGVVGEIKISETTDTTIKGTFNFNAKNVNGDQSIKNITEGSFTMDLKQN